MPRPSAGSQSSRVYGFALNAVVARKNTNTTPSVPVTNGISSRLLARLDQTAIAEYSDRINAQKSIEPA